MRRLKATLAALLTMIATSAFSAEMAIIKLGEDRGEAVYAFELRGYIDVGDDVRFLRTMERASQERRMPGILILDSHGGDTHSAIDIADLIDTRVPMAVYLRGGQCDSACAVIALASDHLFIEGGARIGLHQAWIPDGNGQRLTSLAGTLDVADALTRYGMPESVIRKLFSAGPNSVSYLSMEELQALGAHVKVEP